MVGSKEQSTEQERLKLWREAARGAPADDATVRAASVQRGYEGSCSAGSSSLANSRGGGDGEYDRIHRHKEHEHDQ
jgi:hypothetical protein